MGKKKKFAFMTGFLGALGLVAYLGHKKQEQEQQTEEAVLAEARAFFEPMGKIEVAYLTPNQSRAGAVTGGVVFDDGVVFEFRYYKGEIDYKEASRVAEAPELEAPHD